jgi:uncharacterized membrane protein YhiD involved in acid resistance
MFVSCKAIIGAIGTAIGFLFWLALTIAGLIVWLVFLFYDNTGKKVRMRRKKKYFSARRQEEENADVDFDNFFRDLSQGALYLSFFGLWIFVLCLSKLLGFIPRPILLIAVIAQGITLIVKRETTLVRPWYIGLVSFTTLASLLYVFGVMNTFTVAIPVLSLSITFTVFFWLAFSIIFSVVPAMLTSNYEKKGYIFVFTLYPLLGIIIGGILGGGIWWVLLGLTVGYTLVGVLQSLLFEFGFHSLLLLPIFTVAGSIFAYTYFGSFRWTVFGFPIISSSVHVAIAGAIAGIALCLILNLPYYFWSKARIKRQAIRAEDERRKKDEYEQNRSITEKLAELEEKAVTLYQKNSAELKEAKKEFSGTIGKTTNLDELFEEYRQMGDDVFKSSFWDAFSSSGVDNAQAQVMVLQDIALSFAARYRVSAAKAKLENDIYTTNRKKALLFAERLKEIYDKLTANQKKRVVKDAAQSFNIGGHKIVIPDSLKSIDKMSLEFSNDRKEALLTYFRGYESFKRQSNLSDGASAVTFLATMAIGGLISKYDDNQELKQKLYSKQKSLFKKIKKLEDGRLKAEEFTKRAAELNRALEGTMNAYEKMFVEIFNILYPPGDDAKSKEARNENKKNGGKYFTDDEAEAVVQLRTTGQFLLNLVDTKFEGDNDE